MGSIPCAFAITPALVSAPTFSANWTADSDNRWTLPMGSVGKIFHLGMLPVNMQLSGCYNVLSPDFGADWQIRAQAQFVFPKED